jgi:hypothetical protein
MALVLSRLNIPHAIAHQAKLSKPHSTKLLSSWQEKKQMMKRIAM